MPTASPAGQTTAKGGVPEDTSGNNRLANEQSPYLLQHADNLVDWHPWGDEAFEKARREDKPVFVSIGYSACHWCHVMEEESFEDEDVALLLNEVFVPVLVDREERPDLDGIYMTVANVLTGGGGWPLNVILTPDMRPFFAATYIPRSGRPGQPGLLELIPAVADSWHNRRGELEEVAGQITDVVERLQSIPAADDAPDQRSVERGYQRLVASYDPEYGGFSIQPKFPQPHALTFLLRYAHRSGKADASAMVETTLQSIRNGGIFDQVGFGLHRYAIDQRWLVPHFEKMLYDQALATYSFLEAYAFTGDKQYAKVAAEILEYVNRDMTSLLGGFYSAEDADSEGVEGKFYLWTEAELIDVLGADAELVAPLLGVRSDGNFVPEVGPNAGENILYRASTVDVVADTLGIAASSVADAWESSRDALLASRERRVRPLRDDKVLTDWNGLMIAALARAGALLNEPAYLESALRAFDFLVATMRRPDGRLFHRYRDGEVGIEAFLDDYAFLLWGAIELHQATQDPRYLAEAVDLADQMVEDFWDDEEAGFFFTAGKHDGLLVRPKESFDGAIPSGNSVAALQLARLARLTGRIGFEDKAWGVTRAFGTYVNEVPEAHFQMLTAVNRLTSPGFEIVVVGPADSEQTQEIFEVLNTLYLPASVVLHKSPGDAVVEELAPFTAYQEMINNAPTVYVCENFSCRLPTNSIATMLEQLGQQ